MSNQPKLEEVIKRYEEIMQVVGPLGEEAKKLADQILYLTEGSDTDKIKTSNGTFSFQQRRNWIYSDLHEEKEKELKKLEAEEKQNGTAGYSVKRILVYRSK